MDKYARIMNPKASALPEEAKPELEPQILKAHQNPGVKRLNLYVD